MEKENFKRDIRRIGEVVLLFVFIELYTSFLCSSLLTWIVGGNDNHVLYEPMKGIIELTVSLITSISVVAYGKERLHIDLKRYLRPFPLEAAFQGTCATFFFLMILGIILFLFKALWTKLTGFSFYEVDFTMSKSVVYNICLVLSSVVVAPVFEELIFRGIILRSLARYNKTIAVIFTGILFGMLHMNMDQAIPTMAIGMLFSYISLKYNSLLLPMVLHFVNNSFAMLALNVPFLSGCLSMMELVCMCIGVGVVFSEGETIIRKYTPYAYTKDIFKQWTILLFFGIFLISGIFSLFS